MNPCVPLLATPVSHLFGDPDAARAISAASDRLELGRFPLPEELGEERPILLHHPASLLAPLDAQRLVEPWAELVARERLRVVSLHAPACYDRPALLDGVYRPGGKRLERGAMLAEAGRAAEELRRLLGPGVSLAVENNNYFPTPAYDQVTDPDFLCELVESADVDFLLDLPHAAISARNRGEKLHDYLEALPLERAIQLHFSGWDERAHPARDTHAEPSEMQWELFAEWIERLPRLRYATLEYYGSSERLIELLERMRSSVEVAV